MRPDVGPGEKEVLPLAHPVEERPEHGGPVAAAEADPRLRAGVGDAADRELPGHRPRQVRDLVRGYVGHHSRPAHRGGEELVVDHHDGVEAHGGLDDFDHARRGRVVALQDGHRRGRYPTET